MDTAHATGRDALALAFKAVADVIGKNKRFATNSRKATQELLRRLLNALRGAGWEAVFPELGSSETERSSLVRAVDALAAAQRRYQSAKHLAAGH
jgi:hypothetical protein